MTITKYTKLKESVILTVSKEQNYDNFLCRLKEIFRKEVNSIRCIENIRSIADLIQVLEKRNELTVDNITAIKTIAGALRSSGELLNAIAHYEQDTSNSIVTFNTSYYGNTNKSTEPGPVLSTPSFTSKKRSLIYETITYEIGSHWRDFARGLEIREEQIQQIQVECNNFSEKITKVLEMSERRSEPHKWFYKLCDALESARRKDLQKALQEIIVMNI